jgi:uncharacterized protein YggL (DUF469 family)
MRKFNPPRLFGGSKRYRKKWNLGEFSVYCFGIETGLSKDGYDANKYMDEFIHLVESLGLECGGGISPRGLDMHVSAVTFRKQPTKEDVKVIEEWVKERFTDVRIGPFENAWYPNLPCNYEG